MVLERADTCSKVSAKIHSARFSSRMICQNVTVTTFQYDRIFEPASVEHALRLRNPTSTAWFSGESSSAPECNAYSNSFELSALRQLKLRYIFSVIYSGFYQGVV